MTVYRVTLGIGQTVMGATESYYTADLDPPKAADRINALLAARNKLLWKSTFWTGVRVSQYASLRRSQLYIPGITPFTGTTTVLTVPGVGVNGGTTEELRPDQFRAVLQWKAFFDVDRVSTRYLSNIPDALSATEPNTVDLTANPAWYSAFKRFRDLLVNDGWQIRARLRVGDDAPWPVSGVVTQPVAPSDLGIKVVSMGAPAFVVGGKITLSKFRPAKGTRDKTVNGSWTVDSVDTTSYPGFTIVYLRNSDGIAPASVRITDASRIQNVHYGLFPIQSGYYNRVGIHKRGRPLGSPAGRRLSRPSLDP